MVFSSIAFLYYFLPIILILYFIVPKKWKNGCLLLFSLLFYFYGEPRYILILIFSCLMNYYLGKIIEKINNKQRKKGLLVITLLVNFGMLFYFKYFNFFLDNINSLFATNLAWTQIVMPIGISFFTFQATSYVIDIYRGKVRSAKSLWDFSTYLTLFPQLIAGPIVRYETIDEELENRQTSFDLFAHGVRRFIIGLSKKVLLANVLGEFTKSLASMNTQTVLSHILQMLNNTLQIYFDFSGYSDMAIGLGMMFGFHFLENFNYPLIARSITDLWHRWLISLSSWFKDYIYIPLGGSRVGNLRRYLNIFIVWMVTGLWHGASWNFILWGLYFAIFLIIEKMFLLKFLEKHHIFGHIYTIILVLISFVIFNETDLSSMILFFKNMFGFGKLAFSNIETMYYFKNYVGVLTISILAAIPWLKLLLNKLKQNPIMAQILSILEPIILVVLLVIVTGYIVDESFNPFLYFRF